MIVWVIEQKRQGHWVPLEAAYRTAEWAETQLEYIKKEMRGEYRIRQYIAVEDLGNG